jgi:hypothetical protein
MRKRKQETTDHKGETYLVTKKIGLRSLQRAKSARCVRKPLLAQMLGVLRVESFTQLMSRTRTVPVKGQSQSASG